MATKFNARLGLSVGSPAIDIIDSSGIVTLNGLTASQAVFTDASKNLVSKAVTGTGSVVLAASPTLTGMVTLPNSAFTATGVSIGTQVNVSIGTLSYGSLGNTITIGGNYYQNGGGPGSIIDIGANGFQVGGEADAAPTTTNIYGNVNFRAKDVDGDESVTFNKRVTFSNSGPITVNGTATFNSTLSTSNITGITQDGNITLAPFGTGTVDVSSKRITSVATPTQPNDAVNKAYVDTVAENLHIHEAANCATTNTLAILSGGTVTYNNGTLGVGATLTLSVGLSTIDSFPLTSTSRILVKNEVNQAHNGIYVRTSATVLTRATDFDTAAEIGGGDFIFVESGSTYASTGWVQTFEVLTVGTDTVIWRQFSGSGTFTAGNGLILTGSTFDVVGTANRITANVDSIDIASTYVGQSTITTLGTIGTGTWQGTLIAGQYGGTGVNNSGKTITIGGNFTHTGAHTLGLTTTANTSISLPTSGTLATLAGTETLTNKTLTSPTITNGATINATTEDINIGTLQTTGVLNIGTNTARTGQIRIGSNNTGENAIFTNTFASGSRNALYMGGGSTGSLVRIGTTEGENETPSDVEVNGKLTIGDTNYITYVRGGLNVGSTFGVSLTATAASIGDLRATGTLQLTGVANVAQVIATAQTTGELRIGGSLSTTTGAIYLGQSIGAQTVNIATGANTATKTLNLGTGSASGATNITIGATSGTSTTTLNGVVRPSNLTASQAVFTDASKNLVSVATTGTGNVVLSAAPTLTGQVIINGPIQLDSGGLSTNFNGGPVNINATGQGDTRIGAIGEARTTTLDDTNLTVNSDTLTCNATSYFNSPTSFTSSLLSTGAVATIATGQTTGAITIGGTGATGDITLGRSTGAQNVNICSGVASTSIVNIGGTGASTGAITLGRSTGNQTVGVATGATASGSTKTINIGTNSVSGSTTTITIGSASGTTTTINGSITASGKITSTVGGSAIELNGATSNYIAFNANGAAAPTFTTISTGTKIVLYPSLSAGSTNYAIGIDGGTLWNSIANPGDSFKWFGGTTLAATLTGAGALSTTADATINGMRLGRGTGNIASNIAFGPSALLSNTSGSNNTAIGSFALANNTSGQYNTAIGKDALVNQTIGTDNTAIGFSALFSCNTATTGASQNVAIGTYALSAITTGYNNVAIGFDSLRNSSSGSMFNTGIGWRVLYRSTTGVQNTAIGDSAGYGTTTGARNVFIGRLAGTYITGGVTELSNPNNSVFIGQESKGATIDDTNSIVIGYLAQGLGNNSTVIGNSSILSATINGALQAGTNVTTTSTANLATGATTSGQIKTVNIGTAGLSGSTTNINIGSQVTGAVDNIRIDGNIGVNTAATTTYQLQVNGAFAATTKSFVIPHPTKPGKQLRYGSLEGPENGVYVRGRLKGNKIELPEYWTKLVDPDSITVDLTPIGKHQKLYVEDIADNTVIVGNENMLNKEINCFYVVYGERADVDKLQVEID